MVTSPPVALVSSTYDWLVSAGTCLCSALVGILDRVEVERVDLVGQILQLAAVALDLGLDD